MPFDRTCEDGFVVTRTLYLDQALFNVGNEADFAVVIPFFPGGVVLDKHNLSPRLQ